MGSLKPPPSGIVYFDTNAVIYSVEKHPVYWPVIQPAWHAAATKNIEIGSSELVLLETLVGPLKSGDSGLAATYETLFDQPNTRLFGITKSILKEAARLRASTRLRTPDAIHAATALHTKCALFVTNDPAFRSVPKLPVAVLDDVLHS